MRVSASTAEQIQTLEKKITDEKEKLIERISTLAAKEKETAKLVALIDEEKAKSAKKIEQLKNQKQAVISREKEEQRKQRTRRLIQNGALAEKYLNCPDIEPAEFEKLLKQKFGEKT